MSQHLPSRHLLNNRPVTFLSTQRLLRTEICYNISQDYTNLGFVDIARGIKTVICGFARVGAVRVHGLQAPNDLLWPVR
jgi:hypothetical protein